MTDDERIIAYAEAVITLEQARINMAAYAQELREQR